MGKNTIWRQVASVPMNWQTFHTQGMVKIDRTFTAGAIKCAAIQATLAYHNKSGNCIEGYPAGWTRLDQPLHGI